MDPCLFLIIRTYDGVKQWVLVLVHVDDCDIAGTTEEMIKDVVAVCKAIWDCTEVDPEYMLGVRRRLTRDDVTGQVLSLELDMIAFVEGMYTSFEDRMAGRRLDALVHYQLRTGLCSAWLTRFQQRSRKHFWTQVTSVQLACYSGRLEESTQPAEWA
jgi:hypothetical protein